MKTPFRKAFPILLLIPTLFLIVYFLPKIILDLRKSAAGTKANIVIDTQNPSGKITGTLWKNISQGGEENSDMIKPVINQLRNLQPQLIRIDHLFDYYQVDQGNNQYDFSRLDAAIDSILATGAIPMLSLSYTPDSDEPSSWDQWDNLVTATAHRYSVEKNISGIYYEVWNEPDLFGNWHYAKNPNYLTLYSHTSRAVVKGASPSQFKLGGPAITAYYSNWIKALFKHAAVNNLRLDFISWHKYSSNPDDYLKDFDNLNQILSDYPQFFGIERLITEIGPNSDPDPSYDNSQSGVHLISLSTKLYGKIHRIFSFEAVDGPSPRSDKSTGWGLLTHQGQAKPRYYALQFLNQLQGQQLSSSGDGTWVSALSSKLNQKVQTLIVNYDSKNRHTESVPITFLNLSPGQYQLKTSQYLGKTHTKSFTVSTSTYTETIYMEPNTAYLLEFQMLK